MKFLLRGKFMLFPLFKFQVKIRAIFVFTGRDCSFFVFKIIFKEAKDMVAYISPKGKVRAVFRNHRNMYRIYFRNSCRADFSLYKASDLGSNKFLKRTEAENILNKYIKTDVCFLEWRHFDCWKGEGYHDGGTSIRNIIGVQ